MKKTDEKEIIPMFPFQPNILRMIEGKNHDYGLNELRQQLENEFTEWSNEVRNFSNEYRQKVIDSSIDVLETLILGEVKPSKRELYELYLEKVKSITKSTLEIPFAGLLRELSTEQVDKLFTFLTTLNLAYSKPTFIDIETIDRQSFDYIFGCKEKPKVFIPIDWKAKNQWLREILAGLQKEKTYFKRDDGVERLKLSTELERQAKLYFTKNNTNIDISSTKYEPERPEYKAIIKFLATL